MREETDYFDSSNLIVFFYKNKKAFLLIGIVAILSSAVIALVLPERFKSTVVVYPSNTSSIAKALIQTTSGGGKADIMEFGEEEKSEQTLEVLNSELVKQRVIQEFNLMKHYDIDTSSSTPYTDLQERYQKNITYSRNVNMAIEIEVLDEDPKVAANIANRIVEIADDVMNEIQKKRAIQGFRIVERSYQEKVNEIDSMEKELSRIMAKGVLDISSQAEVYSDAYAQAITKGNQKARKDLDQKIAVLSKHGSRFLSLNEQLENERMKLSDLKAKYDEAKVDAEERILNFFVVQDAFPAEKKTYPIRWLIVAMSTIGALLVGTLSLLLFEQIQKIKYATETK